MSLGHGASIVRDGLVLHLDAANPKSYPGSGTTWYDISGNEYHAALTGTYEYASDNSFLFNSGAQLDGDGRATVDFGASSVATAVTVECIFKINRFRYFETSGNMGPQLFSSGRTTGNYDRSYYIYKNGIPAQTEATDAGYAWYDVNDADGGPANIFNVNEYCHGCVTVPNPGNITFYHNGAVVGTDTTTEDNFRISSDWSISNQPPGFDFGVDSNFYVCRVYNRILTEDEVKQNFEASRYRFGI
jgi:hypothetical protein